MLVTFTTHAYADITLSIWRYRKSTRPACG